MSSGVLTRDECATLAQRLFGLISGGKAEVQLEGSVGASTRFARGEAYLGTATEGVSVSLMLAANDRRGSATSTRLDDAGLKLLVAEAEIAGRQSRGRPRAPNLLAPQVYKTPPKLFFEATRRLMTTDGLAALMAAALDATEAAGLIGAGEIELVCSSRAILNTEGLFGYTAETSSELSLTARTKDGTGSGWAWSGFEDWGRVDPAAVIARAVDLAQRSAKPVAVEPGRYTVILEPAAVAGLLMPINWMASSADQGYSVFAKDPRGTNKIGLKMLDERLSMVSDPWDTEAPRTTVAWSGDAVDRVQWFEHGVLQTLAYDRAYAAQQHRRLEMGAGNLRLYADGSTQTLDEMIATTKRGVWVNRLSGVRPLNERTLLLTGTTRDGTFLIENGKITKAIKNFRFTESPFFALNKLEAFGEPVRASSSIVAPRLKVRDFDFTSLTDAA